MANTMDHEVPTSIALPCKAGNCPKNRDGQGHDVLVPFSDGTGSLEVFKATPQASGVRTDSSFGLEPLGEETQRRYDAKHAYMGSIFFLCPDSGAPNVIELRGNLGARTLDLVQEGGVEITGIVLAHEQLQA